jgi:hypothetical protein
MTAMGLHLHEHDLPFGRNIRHDIQLASPVAFAWADIPPDYPPSDAPQMRRRDILAPAATLNAAVHAWRRHGRFDACQFFNKFPDHRLSPILLPV